MTLTVFFTAVGFLTVAPSTTALRLSNLKSIFLSIKAIYAVTVRRALSSGPEAFAVIFTALASGATALVNDCLGLSFLGLRGFCFCFVVKQLQLLQSWGRRFGMGRGILVVGEKLFVEVWGVLVLEEAEVSEGKRASVFGEAGLHVSNLDQ
jgi:hypothetical protein